MFRPSEADAILLQAGQARTGCNDAIPENDKTTVQHVSGFFYVIPTFSEERRRNGLIQLPFIIHATMADNTCQSEYCNAGWGEVLTHMSPYGYANFGIAFGLGLSVVGAAWGIWLTGSSLVGAAVKAPRIRSKNLIRCVASVAKGSRGRYRDAVGGGTNAEERRWRGKAGSPMVAQRPPSGEGTGSTGSILR